MKTSDLTDKEAAAIGRKMLDDRNPACPKCGRRDNERYPCRRCNGCFDIWHVSLDTDLVKAGERVAELENEVEQVNLFANNQADMKDEAVAEHAKLVIDVQDIREHRNAALGRIEELKDERYSVASKLDQLRKSVAYWQSQAEELRGDKTVVLLRSRIVDLEAELNAVAQREQDAHGMAAKREHY